MEIINVGIMLKDVEYANALAKALSKESSPFMFILIEDKEDDYNNINFGDVFFDIFLTDKNTCIENAVMLVNKQECESIHGEPPFAVFKYKKSGSFINDLLFVYFKLTGRKIDSFESTGSKVIAFCQLEGGSGATSLAIATAMMMHRLYGTRTLYLNIDSFDDSMKYFGISQTSNVIKLLYYLECEKDFPLETFIEEYCQGFDYIDNSLFGLSLNCAEPKLLVKLIQKAQALEQYDYIILDMGKRIGMLHFSLNNILTKLCLLNKNDNKTQTFNYDSLISSFDNNFNELDIMRIETVFNSKEYKQVDQSQFFIEYGDSVFNIDQDKISINLNNNFGTQVKALAVAIREG